jgi:hypothetical protein
MSIPVQPVNTSIVSASINIYECVLNYGLKCVVYMYDQDGRIVKNQEIEIVGDEYNGWVSDDELTTLILSKCGLSRS